MPVNPPICDIDLSPLTEVSQQRLKEFIHDAQRLGEFSEILTTSPTCADLPDDTDIGKEVLRLSRKVKNA